MLNRFPDIRRSHTEPRMTVEKEWVDEDFLRSILASSGDCIKVLDLDANLIFMSEGGLRIMEVSDFNAIQGCPWLDFWQGEESAVATAAVEAAKAGGTGHFQGLANTLAGTPKWWDVQVTPILGADGRPAKLLSVSRDITALRQAEAALRESEDHYRHTVELHPQIPWTAGPDGSVIEMGHQWFQMTGMIREEALPSSWVQAVHEEDLPGLMAAWNDSLQTGKLLDREFRIRRSDGSFFVAWARATPRRGADGSIVRWYGALEDISDRRLAEEGRRRSDSFAQEVLESTSDIVVAFDRSWKITYLNSKAVALATSDRDPKDVRFGDFFRHDDTNVIKRRLGRVLRQSKAQHFEYFLPTRDVWLEINAFPSAGGVSMFMRDVSERKRAQEQLDRAARHDFLTGVPNRMVLYERIEQVLKEAAPQEMIAMLCLDIDYFKEVNDSFGHPAADKLLKMFVNRIESHIRTKDLLARIGGDEFAILQTDLSHPDDAELLAGRILNALREPFNLNGSKVQVGVSIGIAISADEPQQGNALYKRADMALYEAKAAGRGVCKIFEPQMDERFQTARALRLDVANALGRNELFLAFQPIASVPEGVITGAEALLRWRHPTRGLVFPNDFIPIAEEIGQIGPIGAWVLQNACEAASAWPNSMTVSVNLSSLQLGQPDIEDQIVHALDAARLAPERLLLEMTESVLMQDSPKILDDLGKLRRRGVKVVLDDFGTGYSSLSYLSRFEFDKLKIERSFISNLERDQQSRSILEAIMAIAKALKLKVTAEGVETAAQLAYATKIGCDDVQGFLIGHPMTYTQFQEKYASSAADPARGS